MGVVSTRLPDALSLVNELGGVPTASDVLEVRGRRSPDREAFRFLSATGDTARLTYGELTRWVDGIALGLVERAAVGDRALLLLQPGLDFIAAFLACQRAGLVPVPVAPPRAREMTGRLNRLAADCRPRLVLTTAAGRRTLARYDLLAPLVDLDAFEESNEPLDGSRRAEFAFLQYTSGSTGDPKGVIIGHDNLLHNVGMIARAFASRDTSSTVSWLPHYHDMGLVGSILTPLFVGGLASLMAPSDFLREPVSWL